jgi:hypothetical protein
MVRAAEDAGFVTASGKGDNERVKLGFRNQIFKHYNLVPHQLFRVNHCYMGV